MRKQYITIFVIAYFCCSNMLFAQIDRPRRVEIGLFAGPTIDWCGTNTPNYKATGAKAGGVYGLNIDISLVQTSSNYYFSTGIHARHIRFGLQYTDNYEFLSDVTNQRESMHAVSINSIFNTIYVTLPTAIKLKTNNFGRFIIFGIVGLEHGIAVSSKSNDKITSSNETEEKFEKINHYKHTAIAKESLYIVLGTEFIIQDNTKATFGLGYDVGFNNMFRKKYKNSLTNQPFNARA
ncbi:MAG: PorT family protein, partial [Bacteroidales bacterium]|nr:PorT family protein [Bacteroidales bacterium]